DVLQESYMCEEEYKSALIGMQSTVVLQSMFCNRLSSQLATQEKRQKKKKKGQLNGDGLPRLLTSNKFYNRVIKHQREYKKKAAAQKTQKRER
ncbi:hypothetical protein F5I97DRAFT_1799668, partial [Phlebopus sp. FC_14]